jgi:hypothetical protein
MGLGQDDGCGVPEFPRRGKQQTRERQRRDNASAGVQAIAKMLSSMVTNRPGAPETPQPNGRKKVLKYVRESGLSSATPRGDL